MHTPYYPEGFEQFEADMEEHRNTSFMRHVDKLHDTYTKAVLNAADEEGYTPEKASALLTSYGRPDVAENILRAAQERKHR